MLAPPCWLWDAISSRANTNGDPQMLKLDDVSGNYAKEAFAIAPIPNSGKSDLCATGYYLKWDASTKTFTLKRLFKQSDAVYSSLAATPPDFATIYSKTPADEEDAATYVWDLQFSPGFSQSQNRPLPTPQPNGNGSRCALNP